MGATIGGVSLEFDLYWVTKYEGRPVSSNKTALDGTVVTVMASEGEVRGEQKVKFTWITQAQLLSLQALAHNPLTSFSVKCSAEESSFTARFAGPGAITFRPAVGSGEDGLSHGQISSTNPLNLYDGELTLIAE